MQRAEIVWLAKADVDFQKIYDAVMERWGGSYANRFFEDVESTLERVAIFPECGNQVFDPVRRVLIVDGRYGIFYKPEMNRVVIIGIEDLRQNPSRIIQNLGIQDST